MFKVLKNSNFIQAVFWLTIFLMPLFLDPFGLDVFEVPKNILLKISLSVLVIGYSIALLRGKVMVYKRSFFYGSAAFLFVLLLSWLNSIVPSISFWGSFYRQGGLINFLYYLLLFWIAFQVFRSNKARLFFLRLVTVSGILVSFYAILQKFGFDFFPSDVTAIFEGRSFSTLGNPTVLGAYLIFPFFTALTLFAIAKKGMKKWFYFAALPIVFSALLFSANRATILAFLITGFLYCLIRFKPYKKVIIATVLAFAILSGSFIALYGKDSRSLLSRLSTWSSSVEIIKSNPIFGYGPESFSRLFENAVRPDFFQYEDYYNLVDRPHNEALEMWIHLGLLGLLFYLFIFWIALKKSFIELPEKRFIALAVLTFFFSNIFSFSLTIHFFFLTLFLAYIFSDGTVKKRSSFPPILKGGALVLSLLAVLNLGSGGALFYSNHQLRSSMDFLFAQKYSDSISAMQNALQWSPQYADLYSFVFNNFYFIGMQKKSNEILRVASTINRVFARLSQNSLKSQLNQAKIAMVFGQNQEADDIFRAIYQEKGDHPLIFEYWGNFYFSLGEYQKAAIVYDTLLNLLPSDWQIASSGKGPLPKKQRIFWKKHPDFLNTLKNIVTAYQATGQKDKADTLLDLLAP